MIGLDRIAADVRQVRNMVALSLVLTLILLARVFL